MRFVQSLKKSEVDLKVSNLAVMMASGQTAILLHFREGGIRSKFEEQPRAKQSGGKQLRSFVRRRALSSRPTVKTDSRAACAVDTG